MTYELERKYIVNLNAFECGLLMGMIDKEKEFHFELREVKKQLAEIHESTYHEIVNRKPEAKK